MLATLTIQIRFILSFLGITPSAAASAGLKNSSEKGQTADRTTRSDGGVASVSGTSGSNTQKPPQHAECNLKYMLRQTIQEENKMKTRKAKTIIVSGLGATSGLDDKDAVAKLLRVELDARPQIVYCKRLGQPTQGRVRPLLVAMSRAEDAAWIISNAKQLRNSRVRAIRDSVYINANLSKEQSRDAYEQRCKRRTTAEQRQTQNQQPASLPAIQPASQSTQSTAQRSNTVRTSRVVQNSSCAAGSGTDDRHATRQHSGTSTDTTEDRVVSRLVYRVEPNQPPTADSTAQPSTSVSRDRSSNASLTGPQTMEWLAVEHESADAAAPVAAGGTNSASQTVSKSALNPLAVTYVSPSAAGSCITGISA